MTDLSRLFLKKDLLLSRLRNFSDRPETYMVWKSGFKTVMQELAATPMEEIEFLLKWLGPESFKFASSLRTANAENPEKALDKLWTRLDERYGSPELVEASLKARLTRFPKLSNRNNKQLYELADLLAEIDSVKSCEKYSTLLAYFDSSSGVIPIVNKLPHSLREKWTVRAHNYKEQVKVPFPPFSVFVDFVNEMSKIRNDPSFAYELEYDSPNVRDRKENPASTVQRGVKPSIFTRKTEIRQESQRGVPGSVALCPLHKTKHSLNQCIAFRGKPIDERKEFIKQHYICFRCCASDDHIAKFCKDFRKCCVCNSPKHPTALHIDNQGRLNSYQTRLTENRNKEKIHVDDRLKEDGAVSSKCTQVCGGVFNGKSCSKTFLVNVYPKAQPELSVRMYALLDDQSNVSLAKSDFFETFGLKGTREAYTLLSCAGVTETSGRKATDFVVESFDSNVSLELPVIIECNHIPNQRDEIPTPEVAMNYSHLKDIARHIPPVDENAEILLLIGRDLIAAHYVQDQRIGINKAPYAQRLPLGWVIIGETCLGKIHSSPTVNVNKTFILRNGRPSVFKPCPNEFKLKKTFKDESSVCDVESLAESVFVTTKNDDKRGMSVEDRDFLKIMDEEMYKGKDGNWVSPLPFKWSRPTLPNNRSQATTRTKTLVRNMQKDQVKKQHMIDFMKKLIANRHAEIAPPLAFKQECWYLPLFGVYHSKKPGKVRVVFDSSAQHQGISLNDVLMQGPDLTNNLVEILLRFRRHPVAIMGDIQQMFYCFQVREDHRDYLRFLWFKDNDCDKELIEYRMCVHAFGNRPSPAIATYGLQKTAEIGSEHFGQDVQDFVHNDFYVDDGLTSTYTSEQALDLTKRTKEVLQTYGNLRLHKITSNCPQVLKAFSPDDIATDLKELDFENDMFPLQRSLGILWDVKSDMFTFRVSTESKPFTKRGVLSVINSIYDPLGFLAPVIIKGRILLRELMSSGMEWDDPLPTDQKEEWEQWTHSLKCLENLKIPRTFVNTLLKDAVSKEIVIFSDASQKAIAAVAFLKTVNAAGHIEVGFIMGKTKVAPKHGHTVPRLELCAAVLAVEIADLVCQSLRFDPETLSYFTDSKIVLGYIHNSTRRFSVYVSNRVALIRKSSFPSQWKYVSTEKNPADHATRCVRAENIGTSPWLLGPSYLQDRNLHETTSPTVFDELDEAEVQPEITTCITTLTEQSHLLGSHRFNRFSSWKSLVRAVNRLQQWIESRTQRAKRICAEDLIISEVQKELFKKEIALIKANRPLSKESPIYKLNPVFDEYGVLRVGGRLNKTNLCSNVKNPIVIPGKHYIATLLVLHHHNVVQHQGRHFTEGSVRAAGFWIIGGKRLISSLIHKCVKCRKLRATTAHQKMADLPVNRLTPSPPFTFVGVDTFGPWTVVTRRTRGGSANSKRWALLFTCLVIRAIHIEVIEELSSSSFINALRRFVSIRGNVKEFRSDRGTNFIGSTDILNVNAVNVEDQSIQKFLDDNKSKWIFNPPHASHMGGAWERLIGVTRRILDSVLQDASTRSLTHEVLTTVMAEVSAIVNARPLVPVSSDPEWPEILSPSTLLTQKSDHTVCKMLDWGLQDLYKSQWRQVQCLADSFWKRWRTEYLHTLQYRRKWQHGQPNIQKGDLVLLKDKTTTRNEWPMGIVERAILSDDDSVRKAVIRVVQENRTSWLTRPVTELVFLLGSE